MDRTDAPGSVGGLYVDENPEEEIQGTLLQADDRNALQEELIHLIQHAGLTPSASDLQQIRQAVEALIDSYIAVHAALAAAGVHGSAVAATADKLVHRDAAGRAQVAAPAAAADIARKDTVDAVQTNLTSHANTQAAGVHGSAVAATADKLVHRDAAGRAQVAAPAAAADIARKDTVDDAVALRVPGGRQIIAGAGLSGGGDLWADRTLSLAIQKYETAWINRSDWTNVHLGSNTSKDVDSNVAHGLNAPLSQLLVKVFISTNGNDATSFEAFVSYTGSAGPWAVGWQANQVDLNNIVIQTGANGIFSLNSDGTTHLIQSDDWYYKVKVWKIE